MDPGPHMLRAVAAAMAERAPACIPQEISNTVWAFARLRARCYRHPHPSCVSIHAFAGYISLQPS
jgi:hypothetical protein